MSDAHDYGDDARPEPARADLSKVLGLAQALAKAMTEESDLSEKLDAAKKLRSAISEKLLPEAMAECRLRSLELAEGLGVQVKRIVRASFPKDSPRKERAVQYLRDTGNADLLRIRFVVEYGVDDVEAADQFQALMERHGVAESADVTRSETVHPRSLEKLVRELLEAQADPPLEDLGAYVVSVATLRGA